MSIRIHKTFLKQGDPALTWALVLAKAGMGNKAHAADLDEPIRRRPPRTRQRRPGIGA